VDPARGREELGSPRGPSGRIPTRSERQDPHEVRAAGSPRGPSGRIATRAERQDRNEGRAAGSQRGPSGRIATRAERQDPHEVRAAGGLRDRGGCGRGTVCARARYARVHGMRACTVCARVRYARVYGMRAGTVRTRARYARWPVDAACPRTNTRHHHGDREAYPSVFALRHLKNCARGPRSTRERSSSPPPQARLLLPEKFRFRAEEEGEGPVRDGMSWDGAGRCGMGSDQWRLGTMGFQVARRAVPLRDGVQVARMGSGCAHGFRLRAWFRLRGGVQVARWGSGCAVGFRLRGGVQVERWGSGRAVGSSPPRTAPPRPTTSRPAPVPLPLPPPETEKSLGVVAGPVGAVKNCAPSSTSSSWRSSSSIGGETRTRSPRPSPSRHRVFLLGCGRIHRPPCEPLPRSLRFHHN
jgi:hypothetical protein